MKAFKYERKVTCADYFDVHSLYEKKERRRMGSREEKITVTSMGATMHR